MRAYLEGKETDFQRGEREKKDDIKQRRNGLYEKLYTFSTVFSTGKMPWNPKGKKGKYSFFENPELKKLIF